MKEILKRLQASTKIEADYMEDYTDKNTDFSEDFIDGISNADKALTNLLKHMKSYLPKAKKAKDEDSEWLINNEINIITKIQKDLTKVIDTFENWAEGN